MSDDEVAMHSGYWYGQVFASFAIEYFYPGFSVREALTRRQIVCLDLEQCIRSTCVVTDYFYGSLGMVACFVPVLLPHQLFRSAEIFSEPK